MRKLFKIEALAVQSFVTRLNDHSQKTLDGGTRLQPENDISGFICPSCPDDDCPPSGHNCE